MAYKIYDRESKKKCYKFYIKHYNDIYFQTDLDMINKFFIDFYNTNFEERYLRVNEFCEYLEEYHKNNNFFMRYQRIPLSECIMICFNKLLEITREPY